MVRARQNGEDYRRRRRGDTPLVHRCGDAGGRTRSGYPCCIATSRGQKCGMHKPGSYNHSSHELRPIDNRDQRILEARAASLTLKEIAAEEGLSHQRVRQLIIRADRVIHSRQATRSVSASAVLAAELLDEAEAKGLLP